MKQVQLLHFHANNLNNLITRWVMVDHRPEDYFPNLHRCHHHHHQELHDSPEENPLGQKQLVRMA